MATFSTPRPSGTVSVPSLTTGASASIARIRLYAALPRSTMLNIQARASIGQIISPRYIAKLVNWPSVMEPLTTIQLPPPMANRLAVPIAI
ncbi:hypothetical protein D3C76_1154150 [compost metagenome]